jgi:hypothetical protein
MNYIILLILFLLPVFPFSLATNKMLSKLTSKYFSIVILLSFIIGNLLLLKVDIDSKILQFLSVFTLFFYSFRLLGTNNLKTFTMYLYTVISSLSLLWYLIGGNVLEFMIIKTPILASFLALFCFLGSHFDVIHQKSLSGLGNVMPRFSILFILSLMGVSSSLLFLGYEMLEIELSKLPISYGLILIISWVLINWSSIKVIEWLIYGEENKNRIYKDLNILSLSLLVLLALTSFCTFVFYSTNGLGF